jgi:hypothetical protein
LNSVSYIALSEEADNSRKEEEEGLSALRV